jgi:DNA-binding transcriptional LysR family regulator
VDLKKLGYFVVLARHLHFTRAAGTLGIAQSSLSQQIKVFEGELGVRLFDRNNHAVSLTAAGKALLDDGVCLLEAADRVASQVRAAGAGPVTSAR